ncbi:MAG: DUF6252 family protein [Patiriisocius sp.]|uniref:DUF6252 family protein n=1 Tax=Patiriisocius sp. TaxID=2822396 RepID=UPI003EF56BBB
MKLFKHFFLTIIMVSSLVACKSDDDGGDDPTGGTGSFTAMVDGSSYSGLEGTVVAQLTASGPTQVLAVSAGTAQSENLQMIVTTFDGVGTYPLNFTNLGTYSFLPDSSNPDPSTVVIYTTAGAAPNNAGEINISSFDGETVQGTFSFTGYSLDNNSDTVSVTNGEFNITVTNN